EYCEEFAVVSVQDEGDLLTNALVVEGLKGFVSTVLELAIPSPQTLGLPGDDPRGRQDVRQCPLLLECCQDTNAEPTWPRAGCRVLTQRGPRSAQHRRRKSRCR